MTAAAWSINGGLITVSARLRRARLAPQPPYAIFALDLVYAVRYLPCRPCARLHVPHEVDDRERTARCVECRTTRPLIAEEGPC
ncbi:hypothetical protein IPZ58_07800 [Streptomyces roseoverticillatus]|uniref:hypothetical protein n=1 Tax=Streptomyces roseoverticillatus TaxID=66429 RepID=UPI001F3F6017|nr:hypothetical protein [Streptomyces roseoverticillatus]MCF3101482.1 hypothetical protein [Streptomyces roseoverticillatus]